MTTTLFIYSKHYLLTIVSSLQATGTVHDELGCTLNSSRLLYVTRQRMCALENIYPCSANRMSWQLPGGLPWNLVKTFSRGWSLVTLVFPWPFYCLDWCDILSHILGVQRKNPDGLLTFHLGLAAGQKFYMSVQIECPTLMGLKDSKNTVGVVKHVITFQNYKRGTDIHGSQQRVVVPGSHILSLSHAPLAIQTHEVPLGSVCRAKPSCHKASLSWDVSMLTC